MKTHTQIQEMKNEIKSHLRTIQNMMGVETQPGLNLMETASTIVNLENVCTQAQQAIAMIRELDQAVEGKAGLKE